jgi:phosphate transport system permease protein
MEHGAKRAGAGRGNRDAGRGRMSRTTRRKMLSSAFVGFCALSVLLALVPLALILFFVISQGIRAINVDFFTQMPKPVGEPGGGMANGIVGTLILAGLGSLLAIPVGVVSGVYMAEYAGTRFASLIRFAADTLNGVPSIVIGVFVYGIAVLPFKQFSAMAGAIALGVMMIPIIARTTEELLLLVPSTMREGALALGATRARAVFTVLLPATLPGIITGIVLALARIAGETAPLLFTALNNRFFSTSLRQPISSLTVQVYNYAQSPYEDWHRQAWAGALVLVTIVLLCSLMARVATYRLESMHRQ